MGCIPTLKVYYWVNMGISHVIHSKPRNLDNKMTYRYLSGIMFFFFVFFGGAMVLLWDIIW